MKKIASIAACLILAACGGADDEPILGVASNTTLAAVPTTTAAVANTPFTFASGVPSFGTTAATTVSFTSTSATPAFAISSGGATATGTTTFGSCIFTVTASTFPATSALATGKTIVVNPCNINVNTAGLQATGVAASRSAALALGSAVSAGSSITVGVNPGGQLILNGVTAGTVTITPITG